MIFEIERRPGRTSTWQWQPKVGLAREGEIEDENEDESARKGAGFACRRRSIESPLQIKLNQGNSRLFKVIQGNSSQKKLWGH
jgi:hypothetical protein